jgi:hypothetical protein
VLWPVLIKSGWPYNHEALGWKSRIMCYVYHFKQGDLFPYWSSAETFKMGNPLPLYYHKLFYYQSGILFLFLNNMKYAVVVSLTVINFFGVLGMYRSLRRIEVQPNIALMVSISLLFQYYATTDWFIRAAFAEYMAIMVLPWFFYWAFGMLYQKKYSWNIGLVFALTYLAHSIIAYYLIYAIVFCQIFDLYLNRTRFVELLKMYSKAGICAFLLIFIFNFPILITATYYDPSYIKINMTDMFKDASLYFFDPGYEWGKTYQGYTVQLSLVTTISFALILLLMIFFRKQKEPMKKSILIFLGVILLFFFVLQSKFSAPFYTSVPGADFVQFPWRLLSFIQLSALLILAILFNYLSGHKIFKWLCAAYFIMTLVTYPLFKPLKYGDLWFASEHVETRANEGVYGIGEYNPVVKGFQTPRAEFFDSLSRKGIQLQDTLNVVTPSVSNREPEQLVLKYEVIARSADTLILPLNYSGLERAFVDKEGTVVKLNVYRTESDPRIRLPLQKGTYELKVFMPSIKNLFR